MVEVNLTEEKLKDIIKTMIEWNMIDPYRLYDTDYVVERVKMYIEARNFVVKNFKGCF